jgi:DNA-binding MarR family transcriptional regulator
MSTPYSWPPPPPLIGALLRVPANAILRRLIAELNASGFEELRLPHMAVLQFPGPDGLTPGTLAERAGISKQAMNQLLRTLESSGYVARADHGDDARATVVSFTKRGRAAYAKSADILHDIEREWATELGAKAFAELKALLGRVWQSPLSGVEPLRPEPKSTRRR